MPTETPSQLESHIAARPDLVSRIATFAPPVYALVRLLNGGLRFAVMFLSFISILAVFEGIGAGAPGSEDDEV